MSVFVWMLPLSCMGLGQVVDRPRIAVTLEPAAASVGEPALELVEGAPSLDIAAEPEAEPALPQPSGPDWVARFPTSRSIDDLEPPFRAKVEAFVGALAAAGASVHVFATRRPAERTYLMRYAWDVSRGTLDPADVPPMPGVEIEWDHGDDEASRAAAAAMVDAFWLAHRPSLSSRHIEGRAIDMHITWTGTLSIVDAKGKTRKIGSTPRNGADNRALHAVGAGYGVRKLVSDAPHWSSDGR